MRSTRQIIPACLMGLSGTKTSCTLKAEFMYNECLKCPLLYNSIVMIDDMLYLIKQLHDSIS